MIFEISMILLGGATIAWTFVWSRQQRERKARDKFKRELQGYKFTSWKELQAHWKGRLEFRLDGKFDPNRHGNLLETLKVINSEAEKEWIRWNS
jgi:hypothetical protein